MSSHDMRPGGPPIGRTAGAKDPIAKATEEVEEVLGFVRKAVPAFKRVIGGFSELVSALKEEAPALGPVMEQRRLRAVRGETLCPVCVGVGKLGASGHEIGCPECLGKGVVS